VVSCCRRFLFHGDIKHVRFESVCGVLRALAECQFCAVDEPTKLVPPGIFSANDVVVMLEVFVVDAGTSENAVLHAGPW